MIICDKCRTLLTPDAIGFKGEFIDFYLLGEIEFCKDCCMEFKILLEKFLEIRIEEAEPLPVKEHRIFEGRSEKKKK